MKYLLLISLFVICGCGREEMEYPINEWHAFGTDTPLIEWYSIGSNADGVPCKSNLVTGVETPLTAEELKPCDIEIKQPIYGEPLKEGGATVIIGNNHNLIADVLSLIIIACLIAYACHKIYKQGYRDGRDGVIEDTPIKEGGVE